MLPDRIPYSESESLLLLWHFRFFVSFFLIAFSSLSYFLLNCAKDCFVGLGFFPPFLAARKLDFSVSSFSNRRQSRVRCVRAPMLLAKVAMFLGTSFLQDSGCSFSTRLLCTLFLAMRSFIVARSVRVLESFLATYTLDNFERQKE